MFGRAVPEAQVSHYVDQLGVVGPVRKLALREVDDPLFDVLVERPVAAHAVAAPAGPDTALLWQSADRITGVRPSPAGGVGHEFIIFDLEAPNDVDVVSTSEQGVLAELFFDLYEEEFPDADLERAAHAVGFRFLTELIAHHQSPSSRQVSRREKRRQFTLSLGEE